MVSLLIIAYTIVKYKNLKSNYILWYNNYVNISQKAGGRRNVYTRKIKKTVEWQERA